MICYEFRSIYGNISWVFSHRSASPHHRVGRKRHFQQNAAGRPLFVATAVPKSSGLLSSSLCQPCFLPPMTFALFPPPKTIEQLLNPPVHYNFPRFRHTRTPTQHLSSISLSLNLSTFLSRKLRPWLVVNVSAELFIVAQMALTKMNDHDVLI